MNLIEELYNEKTACLILLQQYMESGEGEKAFITANRIMELEQEIELVRRNNEDDMSFHRK